MDDGGDGVAGIDSLERVHDVDDVEDLAEVQQRLDAYGEAAVTDAVADATAELVACRGSDGEGSGLCPVERAVLERLASRLADRTLPDVEATADAGVSDARIAATAAALFPER